MNGQNEETSIIEDVVVQPYECYLHARLCNRVLQMRKVSEKHAN